MMKMCGLEIFLALASLFVYAYRFVQRRRRAVTPIYEVFLSFRGPDTRTGFTDFLSKKLKNGGVRVFLDEEAIPHGNEIGPELRRAIGTCPIAIPIISEQYAQSEWCLEELSEIMDRHRNHCISVFPVFYKVGVDDVKKQCGSFGEALSKLEKLERRFSSDQVYKWWEALTSVAKIRGWISQTIAEGHESELVDMIHERVSTELKKRRIERLPKIIRSVYLCFSKKSKCQVFLAFNDSRVRTGLATYIHASLMAKRIKVFCHDDPSLVGANVDNSIWDAIDECQIYIPIFSESCTSSKWFLKGLIRKIKKEKKMRNILPIYYKMNPLQVRKVLRNFQNPMLTHEDGKLEDVVNIKGPELREEIGNEANLVTEVVQAVLKLLNNPYTES